jgi:hypothetical protein
MKRIRQAVLALAAASTLGFGATVYADHGGGGGPGGPRMGWSADPAKHAEMMERRLADLKAKLNILGGQESQWQAFADKVRQEGAAMRSKFSQAPQANATAPDLMARRAEHMKQRAAGMEGISAALRDLYAVLSVDQRTIIDQHYARMDGRRGHGPRGQGQRS